MKKTFVGTFTQDTFLATTGNPAPRIENSKTKTVSCHQLKSPVVIMVHGSHHVKLTQPRNVKTEIILADFLAATTLWLSAVHDIHTGIRCRARLW